MPQVPLSRRAFLATTAAVGLTTLPAQHNTAPPLRAGLIGRGVGGQQLLGAQGDEIVIATVAGRVDAWNSLVEQEDLDAILIATPDHCHFEMAASALRAGKHVYVLPPFCRTADEARQLESLANATNRVLQVGMLRGEDARWCQARAARKQTGAPRWIQASTPHELPPAETHWQRQRFNSLGPAAQQIYNMLYAIQYHLEPGTPVRATALGGVFHGTPELTPDALLVTFHYEDSARIVLSNQPLPLTRQHSATLRGTEAEIALPPASARRNGTWDLENFAAAILGDNRTSARRLHAATIAQEALVQAMNGWLACDGGRVV